MSVPRTTKLARVAPLLVAPSLALLASSGCDDDSSTPDTTTVGDEVDGGGTDVDGVTDDGNGVGTVLPSETSPRATEAPNPNAGGGGGSATSAP